MLHVSEPSPHVVLLTIDRQHKRNAVDRDTLNAIADAVDAAVLNAAHVIVLTGAGGHFSAGADLGGVEDHAFLDALRRALSALSEAPLVSIAAIDGFALGAGTQMASFCDVRVATDAAVFGIPAAKLGIAVDQATVARVVELCGGATARLMLLTSSTVDAKRAYDIGFVQRIGDLEMALEWASEIEELAPLTVHAHKAALTAVRRSTDGAPDPLVSAAFERAWGSVDLVEGRAAFGEKRKPTFLGR
jgi:enoyl-CoA hydratase